MLVSMATGVPGPGPAVAAGAKPNIVLITTDDQSVSDLQYMPFTRQLLGDGGVNFEDAISPYPLCCPARASIMTGQQAHNHQVIANEPPMGGYQALRPLNDKTLPVWLKNAGYRTTFVGKYLNEYGKDNPTEMPAGWDDFHATVVHPYDYDQPIVNDNGVLVDHGVDGPDFKGPDYQADMTQRVTEAALRYGVANDQPVFVWQSNLAPHGSCELREDGTCAWEGPTPATQDVGTFAGIPMPSESSPSFNERVVVDKPARIRRLPLLKKSLLGEWRTFNEQKAESLQAVDRNVKATIDLIDSLGQRNNTLILFSSDNGFLLGEHRWRGKVLGYEEGVRIPMMMWGPGEGLAVPQGKVVTDTVSLVDLAATIADAAGAEPLLTLDGISLLDLVHGERRGYDAMAIEAGPSLAGVPNDKWLYRGVRTKRYTFMRHPVTGELELYDRRRDPNQLVNVAYRPTHGATRKALEDLLAKLSNCVGATCHDTVAVVPDPESPQGPVHPDELAASAGATQLVTVTAQQWGATRGIAVGWQKRGLAWHAVRGPVKVALGSAGLSATTPRLVGTTPAGVYPIATSFGRRRDPGGALRYRRLRPEDRWSQDPLAPRTYSLMQVKRSRSAGWRRSREVLFAAYPGSFERGVVLRFNRPRQIGWNARRQQYEAKVPADVRKGSLLIHSGRRVGRYGWMSMPTADIGWLARWADPAQHTKIVVGTPKYLRDRL